jgi:DNA polymerase III sliding clamp (beta) subunit (PCNA family)
MGDGLEIYSRLIEADYARFENVLPEQFRVILSRRLN